MTRLGVIGSVSRVAGLKRKSIFRFSDGGPSGPPSISIETLSYGVRRITITNATGGTWFMVNTDYPDIPSADIAFNAPAGPLEQAGSVMRSYGEMRQAIIAASGWGAICSDSTGNLSSGVTMTFGQEPIPLAVDGTNLT